MKPEYKHRVRFIAHDVRSGGLSASFDLILCRNLVFTYFDHVLQHATLTELVRCLRCGGAFIIGSHEDLPAGGIGLSTWSEPHHVFRRL